MRQVGIIAAAGIYALEHHLDRLKEDHDNAKRLALGLKEIREISVDPDHVETNIILFDMAGAGMTALEFIDRMKKEGVLFNAVGPSQIRLVTHLDVNGKDIDRALSAFRTVLQNR